MNNNLTIFFGCFYSKYIEDVISFMGVNKIFFNFWGPIFSVVVKPESNVLVNISSNHPSQFEAKRG